MCHWLVILHQRVKRDEVTGEGRRSHSEDLSELYSSTNIGAIRPTSVMGGESSTYGGEDRCIQGFGEETLGRVTIWKTRT